MTDRLKEAERIAAKWKAAAERLREEIHARRARMAEGGQAAAQAPTRGRLASGWFAAWERQARPLAAAVGALARAEAHAAAAADRVRAAKIEATRATRLSPLKAVLEQRAEAVAEAAAKVKKRWKEDRAKEPKRIKARAKELAKRITKDKRETSNPLRRRRAQAPAGLPEAATWPTGPIVPVTNPMPIAADPPREGLLPGDYIEPARAARIIGQLLDTVGGRRIPERWTPEHVSHRLVEAFRVLRRLPMTTRPKQYGAMWPEYLHDKGDAFGQALSGTLQDRNRAILGTSEDEVSRMHEALAWPMEFLGHDPDIARAVNEWALWNDLDGDKHDDWSWDGVKVIADGLNRKNVVVR